MPTYVYRCPKCETVFELFHSMSDATPKKCPNCKARAQRVPAGGAGLLFKGTGFYITDYRTSGYKEKAKSESGGGSAAPRSESKPEPKPSKPKAKGDA